MSTFASWTWTDREGREWKVTETEERWEPHGRYDTCGVHSWTFEEGEVTQNLYAWKVSPLMHREDVELLFQGVLERSR